MEYPVFLGSYAKITYKFLFTLSLLIYIKVQDTDRSIILCYVHQFDYSFIAIQLRSQLESTKDTKPQRPTTTQQINTIVWKELY